MFRVIDPLCGEVPGPRWIPLKRPGPVTRSFVIFFDLRLNKRLSNQSWSWWFETPSHPLWRHRNGKGCESVGCYTQIAANYEKYIRARDPFPGRSFHQNLNPLGNSFCSDSNLAGANLCRYNFCTWQVWHGTYICCQSMRKICSED